MKKAFVTGANGFIGSQLCEYLMRRGTLVTGLTRPSCDTTFLTNLPKFPLISATLADLHALRKGMEGASVVYHVAGYAKDWGPWSAFRETNVEGTRHVMEAARQTGVKRVVHVSSVSVYGFPGKTNIKEDEPFLNRPDDPYITTKAEGERLALSYHGQRVEVAVVRPSGVYGPNDRTTTAQMAPVLLKGQFGYVDGGRHVMAPVYIENLLQMMELASERPEAGGQVYNAMDDGRVTWREYTEWMCEELGCGKPRLSVPRQIVWPLAVTIEGAAKLFQKKESPMINKYRIRAVMADAHYSTDKAKKDLGYRPTVTTREGLRKTIAWYRAFTHQNRARH